MLQPDGVPLRDPVGPELISEDLMWLLLNSDMGGATAMTPAAVGPARAQDTTNFTLGLDSEPPVENVVTDRKRRRKEKNREAARKCRKKRKEEVNSMQEKLKSLEEENLKLRAISSAQVKPEADELAQKQQLIVKLEELVETDADDQIVMQKVQEYADRFGTSGGQQRAELKQALDRLEELVRATNTKKLCFLAVDHVDQQDTEAGGSSDSGGGEISVTSDRQKAAAMLFKEIGFTEEQRAKLRVRKQRIQEMQREVQQSVQMVRNLRSKVEAQQLILSEQMSQLMKILRPAQAARFLLWTKNNPACMGLLQKLWDNNREK